MSLDNVTVLILCGGEGKRLRPKFTMVPKVLVPVHGEPMLSHILRYLQGQGFGQYVLATGYLSEQIEQYIAAQHPQLQAKISNSGVDAGMLKRMVEALEFCQSTVVVVYGDTLVNLDYADLIKQHRSQQAPCTAVVGNIRNPFGVVQVVGDKIQSFVEKPVYNYYIGCFVFEKQAMQQVPSALLGMPDGRGLVEYFQGLIQKQALHAYQHQGLQITFNTVSELEDAEAALTDFYTMKESE